MPQSPFTGKLLYMMTFFFAFYQSNLSMGVPYTSATDKQKKKKEEKEGTAPHYTAIVDP
jgi:hypothetical protein